MAIYLPCPPVLKKEGTESRFVMGSLLRLVVFRFRVGHFTPRFFVFTFVIPGARSTLGI